VSQNLVNDCLILNTGEGLPRERSERFGHHPGFASALLANRHIDVA
jgi:hypothetical protein